MANKVLPSINRRVRGVLGRIASEMSSPTPEIARALPSAKGGETQGELQTARFDAYTIFPGPAPTQLIYNAENWVRVTLTLQTAGPVAVGNKPELAPVLGGAGFLLDTNVPVTFTLPRATRLYMLAGAVNAVGVVVEPIPWMEQISSEILRVIAGIAQLGQIFRRGAGAPVEMPTVTAPHASPAPVPQRAGGTRLQPLPAGSGSGLPLPPLRR